MLQSDRNTPLQSAGATENQGALVRIPVGSTQTDQWILSDNVRQHDTAEDCLAVRGTWQESGKLTFLHYPIDAGQLDGEWMVRGFNGDRKIWHGAPVLAASDGKVIGVLLVEKRETKIVPLESF